MAFSSMSKACRFWWRPSPRLCGGRRLTAKSITSTNACSNILARPLRRLLVGGGWRKHIPTTSRSRCRPGAVMEGLHSNAWDVAFLAFDPSRAEVVDYTPAYIRSDFTYMVPAGSSLRSAADADRPGIRIVTPRNDGSDLQLTRALKQAQLIRTGSQAAALELLRIGGAEARAAPRPTLLADVPKLPGRGC
jgi:hypothetical protein